MSAVCLWTKGCSGKPRASSPAGHDSHHRRRGRPSLGFTASAFAGPVRQSPLVLVCLDRSADCHSAFGRTHRFAVSILGPRHTGFAVRLRRKEGVLGTPRLQNAVATVECGSRRVTRGGDHTILVGRIHPTHSLGPRHQWSTRGGDFRRPGVTRGSDGSS
ncbi:flavin reductase [Prauserella oleivorans]|uniref:Flavin reductase n=2 Tax=Pseudonocardiaceae TaxID=2070 RepID=A0A8E1W7M0_9PSEU|nr:flavin reductase [Amycolatopsis echigonensis]RBM20545.1 hypothetical protein DI005_12715 [Prauserella sp. PE36]